MLRYGVLIAVLFSLTGCASAYWAGGVNRLKTISAGYTGCLPDANEISNVKAGFASDATWNATCQGKVYLCSQTGNVTVTHCAPAVK